MLLAAGQELVPQAPPPQGDASPEDAAALLPLEPLLEPLLELPEPVLLYKSEYQPPPFRMNPAPPEIWRFAAAALHEGQSLSGSSEIRCSASQTCPQAVQM